MEPFIGEIRLLPYTFAPRGWALCNGQLLTITSNTALFSILGTAYGGNGQTTFGLPNLQGCVVPGAGTGPGLQTWEPGMEDGSDTVTLLQPEMPQHTHMLNGLDVPGTTGTPSADAWLGQDKRGGQGIINALVPATQPKDLTMALQSLAINGGSSPHENRQPFLAMNFCIATTGLYPPRN